MYSQNNHASANKKWIIPKFTTPRGVLVMIIVGVFIAEFLEELIVHGLNLQSDLEIMVVDELIMIAVIFPFIYFFSFRILLEQINERKRSEALLSKVLESLPVGVWIADPSGEVMHGNPAGQQIWGGARFVGIEEYEGYKGWWVDSGKPVEAQEWAIARAIKKGETSVNEEIEIESFDGAHKFILNSAIPLLDEHQTFQGAISVNEDITMIKRAEEQLERQNRELQVLSNAERKQRQFAEALFEASSAVNASLDLEKVLDRILFSVQRAIPFTAADILLIEDGTYYTAQHWGYDDKQAGSETLKHRSRIESLPILETVYQSQQPVLISDTNVNDNQMAVRGEEWARSCLAAPLAVGGTVTGCIILYSDRAGYYTQDISERLVAFAASAAVAVQNARLYMAELHAREVAETISAESLALTQTLDLETVVNTLLDNVHRLVAYDGAYVLLSEDESRLSVRAIHSYNLEVIPLGTLHAAVDAWNIPYLKKVMLNKESLLIPDTQEDPEGAAYLDMEAVRNWLGIPLVVGGRAIGLLALVQTNPRFFTREHIYLAEAIAAQASVAIQNAWLFEQVRAAHERFQSLSHRLVEVQESERRYIARELHDETSQALTSIIFGLRLLEQEVDHPENLLPRLVELKQVVQNVLENLHHLAINLRPVSLDQLGLVPALTQLVKDVGARYSFNSHFKAVGFAEENRFPEEIETALFRIAQEALTNTVRYANANNVDVILERRDGSLIVMIEDDGIGFDAESIPKSGHLGILGMQERAQMAGGTLTIESSPGEGTTIVVEVPYASINLNR